MSKPLATQVSTPLSENVQCVCVCYVHIDKHNYISFLI